MATIGETTRPGFVYDSASDTWIPVGIGPHSHTPAAIGAISSSLVTTKGDLIVATGSGTVVRQGVGADGSMLVADSSQADGVTWAGPSNIAGKNLCINGGMDFWQRGTSFGGTTLGAYGADRWGYYRGGAAGGATWSRQSSGLTGFQYSLRAQRDSGNTSTQYVGTWQGIETTNSTPYAGKTVTLSFYAKCGANYSPASSGLTVVLVTGTGTDQPPYNFTGATAAIDVNAILTTSWQRYTYTATLPSNTNEIAIQFVGYPTGTAGANDWYEITGVQLEQGAVATHFSRAGGSIGGELAACQRYYVRLLSATNMFIGQGQSRSGTIYSLFGAIPLPVSMRTSPSLAINALTAEDNSGGGLNVTVVFANTTPNNAGCYFQSASNWGGNYGVLLRGTGGTSYMEASAEL